MRVQIFQHVPFEDLGSIRRWLDVRGAGIAYTRFFAGDGPPLELDGVDLLIALGGPMSVNDEAELPWLVAEKQALRDAIARGVPVLGICLGAQLIASALGARVFRNPVKEIGWYPIQGLPSPASAFRFPPTCTVFHWHGETFDLPPGAVRLASSAGCENQALQIGRLVIGLQFHLETTADAAGALLDHCRDELVPGPYVQPEAELRAVPPSRYVPLNALMDEVLTYLAGARARAASDESERTTSSGRL